MNRQIDTAGPSSPGTIPEGPPPGRRACFMCETGWMRRTTTPEAGWYYDRCDTFEPDDQEKPRPGLDHPADENISRVVYCAGCNRDERIRDMHRNGWRIVAGDPLCPHCDDPPDEWIDQVRDRYETSDQDDGRRVKSKSIGRVS